MYLAKLAKELPYSHYDPEIFPGLMYKNTTASLPFHITIMGNGSFVITGVAGENKVKQSLKYILPFVEKCYCKPVLSKK